MNLKKICALISIMLIQAQLVGASCGARCASTINAKIDRMNEHTLLLATTYTCWSGLLLMVGGVIALSTSASYSALGGSSIGLGTCCCCLSSSSDNIASARQLRLAVPRPPIAAPPIAAPTTRTQLSISSSSLYRDPSTSLSTEDLP